MVGYADISLITISLSNRTVVDYTTQLQAAWWAWHAYLRRREFPRLRLCFAAAAGLAPVHHERLVARGGRFGERPLGIAAKARQVLAE